MSDPDAIVERTYVDAFRARRAVPEAVRAAVVRALGPSEPGAPDPVRVARPGATVDPPAALVLEDGTSRGEVARLPRDLPHGYHLLRREVGDQLLLVAPRHARLPTGRSWGWSTQLYASRSTRSWGFGDLGDLRDLATWAGSTGAGWLLLNPLNAPNPGPNPEPSPYYPSTRRFRDPLYLRVEELPRASEAVGLAELAAAGRALDADRSIQRGRVLALKRAALERIWALHAGAAEAGPMRAYRQAAGPALRRWAVFCVISERHGPGWQSWPAELRDPTSAAVGRLAAEAAGQVAFHEWLQLLLDSQLAAASEGGVAVINDLPVGFDPGGFDAWDWQGVLALDAAIGSPPDRFNPIGQDWGLPPFSPHRLRGAHYGPFVETVRAALRHAGGLRIDHVLGLFRQWWVPRGNVPADGAYVRFPVDELLAVLAIESERAGAIVIGEDLGTVEAGVRSRLRGGGILSTRLGYFERRLDRIPHLALASMTTHDLPTLTGAWTGSDLASLRLAAIPHDPAAELGLKRKLADLTKLGDDASAEAMIMAAHRLLAGTPAALVMATLEDGLGVAERPNVPGSTVAQRPNWSLALPVPIDAFDEHPRPRRLAAVMREARPPVRSEGALANDLGDVDPAHGSQDR